MAIKILHVIPTLSLGGAERLVADICTRLPRGRFESVVVTTVRGGPLEDELAHTGVRLLQLDEHMHNPSSVKFLRWFERACALASVMRREAPDIVHTHLTSADIPGWHAASRAQVLHIVSTEHNINIDEKKWQTALKKTLAGRVEKIACLSEAIKEFVQCAYRVPEDKCEVIYDGVDIQKFVPRTGGFPSAAPQITVVARLEPQKGHRVLLDALAMLKDMPWELQIAGEGSLKDALLQRARACGIDERVHFLGARRDIAEVLQKTDICVLPSLWEGLGISVLEAMATGLPVVASKVGGIPEMVIDKETGVLVPPHNAEALADALRALLNDPARARAMGARGRRRVEEQFAVERTVESYQKLYEKLMN